MGLLNAAFITDTVFDSQVDLLFDQTIWGYTKKGRALSIKHILIDFFLTNSAKDIHDV